MRDRKRRDLVFFALVALQLVLLAGFLASSLDEAATLSGRLTYRRVDLEALHQKLRAGDLVDDEARWYRTVQEE